MNFFRNRQQQISVVAMTLLLGGWFAVVCQNCMAHSSQTGVAAELAISNHCDETEETKSNKGDESCAGVCDCSAVVSNVNSTSELEFYSPLEQDTPVFSSLIDKNLFIANQVSSIPHHPPPDCSQLSPINTYCVQIK